MEFKEILNDMRQDRHTAEAFILEYQARREKYEQQKEEELEKMKDNDGGPSGNLPSSPTERAAVLSVQYDQDHWGEYSWLQAVEVAMKTFGERKHIFIAVRREADSKVHRVKARGRHGWVVYTQRRYSEEINKRFINDMGWLADRTVKQWWHQIIDSVVEIHLRIGKKVFEKN